LISWVYRRPRIDLGMACRCPSGRVRSGVPACSLAFHSDNEPLCVSAYIGLSNPIREAPGAARLDPWRTSVRMGAPDRWTTPPESLERLDLSVSERSSLCKERISSAGSSSLREADFREPRLTPTQFRVNLLQVHSVLHRQRSEKKSTQIEIDRIKGDSVMTRLIFSRCGPSPLSSSS